MRSASIGLRPPPDDPQELRAFPRRVIEDEEPLYRVVREGRLPWWFGSTMQGRFDLPEPFGTCYLAHDDLSAILEVLGNGPVTPEFVQARRIYRLFVPHSFEVANTRAHRATFFGITAEIGTLTPYRLPQAWAQRLQEAGAQGISYWLRHDPARAKGCALFSQSGSRTSWPKGRVRTISQGLLRRLRARHGLQVLTRPRSSQLTFIDD